MAEELAGGYRSAAHRIGNAVHRGPIPQYAIALLEYLTAHEWPYSPVLLQSGEQTSVLQYIEGIAATTPDQQAAAAEDGSLAAVARIVRELHDLTAGSRFAMDGEVACHNDLDPRNTIYKRNGDTLSPIAIIDWDLAGPGERVHDLAHVCWTYTGIGPAANVDLVRHRIYICLDAYGWSGTDGDVVDAMMWWQDRCRRGIETEAAAGDPAMQALVDSGITGQIRDEYAWTARHLRPGAE